ncbi:MAG: serine/threonine protein kinase [Chromatiales bacterium]|nr:serine/threonine protein kinase [Chromatiales bacterium]
MSETPYDGLTPDRVLDAIESLGLQGDGRVLTLNSYENRVYQLGMEEGPPLIAKFYRPERWSDAGILEEHAFVQALVEREIPAVAPLALGGSTLNERAGYRIAIYRRQRGRAPEFTDFDTLEWMGRFLGRIHAVGALQAYEARPTLDVHTFGHEPRAYLLSSDFIPAELRRVWEGVSADALRGVERCYARAGALQLLRLHGDCYAGNVLWSDDGPHFVDFDDSRMGPAIQDLWMLLSGDRAEMALQLSYILDGYEDFHDFDRRELHLIEALRTLRLIHYSAWIARRWHDPAFPAAFPWFASPRYWQDRILELREQIALMDEEPPGLGQ